MVWFVPFTLPPPPPSEVGIGAAPSGAYQGREKSIEY